MKCSCGARIHPNWQKCALCQTPIANLHILNGITLEDLKAVAGVDWDDIKNDSSKLNALALILYEQKEMRAGIIPSRFTAETFCLSCNKNVPVPPALTNGGKVLGCMWCSLRVN